MPISRINRSAAEGIRSIAVDHFNQCVMSSMNGKPLMCGSKKASEVVLC